MAEENVQSPTKKIKKDSPQNNRMDVSAPITGSLLRMRECMAVFIVYTLKDVIRLLITPGVDLASDLSY